MRQGASPAAPIAPIAVIAAMLSIAAPGLGAQTATSPVSALGWMAGCWARESNGRLVEEFWQAPRAGTMLGVSRTTAGDRLVEYEALRIYAVGDTLVLAAAPARQAPAEFRAAPPHTPGGEIVFADPAHDFPQRIRYRPAGGGDSLVARIEGTSNGAQRAVDYRYARVACPGTR